MPLLAATMAPNAAVRDLGRELKVPGLDGSAARRAGGDVGAADQVAVPGKPAVRAGERPPGGLGHAPGEARASRRGPALVHQHGRDAGLLGLVGQAADEVADPPVPDRLLCKGLA
jgi:hypothetical protein